MEHLFNSVFFIAMRGQIIILYTMFHTFKIFWLCIIKPYRTNSERDLKSVLYMCNLNNSFIIKFFSIIKNLSDRPTDLLFHLNMSVLFLYLMV